MTTIVEGEHETRYPLHDDTEDKGYCHRYENGYDDAQCLVGVEEVAIIQRVVANHLEQGKNEGTAQEFEDKRYGSGGRHAHGVEHVEHHHIGDHNRQENGHHFGK